MSYLIVNTERLQLISSSAILAETELKDRSRFYQLLGVNIPQKWPPLLNNNDTIKFFVEQLKLGKDQEGWWCWYFIKDRELIGNGGFKGKPSKSGTVELGYSILPEYQNKGYATEAVRGLLDYAFNCSQVTRVIAETSSEVTKSIRVLEKCGFIYIGEGSEAGAIKFGLLRRNYNENFTNNF